MLRLIVYFTLPPRAPLACWLSPLAKTIRTGRAFIGNLADVTELDVPLTTNLEKPVGESSAAAEVTAAPDQISKKWASATEPRYEIESRERAGHSKARRVLTGMLRATTGTNGDRQSMSYLRSQQKTQQLICELPPCYWPANLISAVNESTS